jgi:hypothetical protein
MIFKKSELNISGAIVYKIEKLFLTSLNEKASLFEVSSLIWLG